MICNRCPQSVLTRAVCIVRLWCWREAGLTCLGPPIPAPCPRLLRGVGVSHPSFSLARLSSPACPASPFPHTKSLLIPTNTDSLLTPYYSTRNPPASPENIRSLHRDCKCSPHILSQSQPFFPATTHFPPPSMPYFLQYPPARCSNSLLPNHHPNPISHLLHRADDALRKSPESLTLRMTGTIMSRLRVWDP